MKDGIIKSPKGTHAKIVSIDGLPNHDTKSAMNSIAIHLTEQGYSVLVVDLDDIIPTRNCYDYEYNMITDRIYNCESPKTSINNDDIYKMRKAFMQHVQGILKFNHVHVTNIIKESSFDVILINNFIISNYIECLLLYIIRKCWCMGDTRIQYNILLDLITEDDLFLKLDGRNTFYNFKPDMLISFTGFPCAVNHIRLNHQFRNHELNYEMKSLYKLIYDCTTDVKLLKLINGKFSDTIKYVGRDTMNGLLFSDIDLIESVDMIHNLWK